MRKIIIATHVYTPGTSQAFRDYCLRKKYKTLYIQHSIFGNVFTWLIGAIDVLWKVLSTRSTYDMYVGFDNVNAFVGLILKRIGVVRRVIFMTPDYSHTRFTNSFLNTIYHWLDYYCLRKSDMVWNSSSVMVTEREKRGVSTIYRNKQIMVPDGTDDITPLPFEKRNRYEIIFVGHLKNGMGLEMFIQSYDYIHSKIPSVKFTIIGAGPIENKLRYLAKGKNIEFTGLIVQLDEVYKRLTRAMIGIAPYEKNSLSENTDPGKIKLYLSAHLPIIVTKVPLIAYEIEEKECGVVIDPSDRNELEKSIVYLLTNEEKLKKIIKNTKALAVKYKWDTIFDKAMRGKEV